MFKFKRNKKGFSLIEILVAISIIAVVIVPLAMNLISGARMNSKAKKVSASTDISTSLIETMQTVDLGDIMIELNSSYKGDGATMEKDEYHGDVSKALLKALQDKGFEVEDVNMFETKKQSDGAYVKISDKSQSSVMERLLSNNTVKNYFVGQANNEYSFVLRNLKNGEMTVDVAVDIKGIHSYDLVNITSMQHSDAFYVKQPTSDGKSTMDYAAADSFYADHQLYGKITGKNSSELKNKDWFFNNMKRSIIVDIVKDKNSDAVTMTISAEYTVADDSVLQKSDQKIVKELGSFTTNSTAELVKGIHVYYNPLTNLTNRNQRDTLIVNNKQEVKLPVFFIALDQDASTGFNVLNYRPTLRVNESNNVGTSYTTICTNLINGQEDVANKLDIPSNQKQLIVKTMGNATTQQILYSISLQVYNHKEDSHSTSVSDEGNVDIFTPREKDLLSKVEGTFIDTSEKIDVNNESTGGDGAFAYINGIRTVYTGSLISGVDYRYVDIELGSTTQAINAGVYTVVATPKIGRTWSDGSTDTRTITWEITRAPTTEITLANYGNLVYNAREQYGFSFVSEDLKDAEGNLLSGCFTGTYKAKNAGRYSATFTPDSNHCWADDGTITARTYTWIINKKPLTITWPTGDGRDIWVYDGTTHEINPTVSGIISGDTCSFTVRNNYIKDVGEKYAEIASLSNSNYTIDENRDHKIRVVANKSATYELYLDAKGQPVLTYNGSAQDIVKKSSGVRFRGDRTAKNANTYTLIAEPMEGYAWAGTEDDYSPITITWTIAPKEVSFKWGGGEWTYAKQVFDYYNKSVPDAEHPRTYQVTYDGIAHEIPCQIQGIIGNDVVRATLTGHVVTDEGVYTAKVVTLSNSNYKVPTNNKCLIEVVPKSVASVTNYAPATKQPNGYGPFTFNNLTRTGVVGNCVDIAGTPSAKDVLVDYDNEVVDCYKAYVTPKLNYSWGSTEWENKPVTVLVDGKEITLSGGLPVGSKYTIVVEWMILPIEDAWYEAYICTYNGSPHTGVSTEHTDLLKTDGGQYGVVKTHANTSSIPYYIAPLRPAKNHAWASAHSSKPYDVSTINVQWKIINFSMNMPQVVGDSPIYNGKYQAPNVLVFSNYDDNAASAIQFTLYKNSVSSANKIAGPQTTNPHPVDAGTYVLRISILPEFKDSFSWVKPDGTTTTADVDLTWKILPMEIGGCVINGSSSNTTNTWTYDGQNHTGEARFDSNALKYNERTKSWDTCTFTYSGNVKKNAGTYYFTITGTSNSNYTASYNNGSGYIYTDKSGDAYGQKLSMKINTKGLGIDWSSNSTNYQNTTSFNITARFTGLISGESRTPSYSGTRTTSTIGQYTVNVTGFSSNDPANYHINSNATKSFTYEVWRDAAGYGGLNNYYYTGRTITTSAKNSGYVSVTNATSSSANVGTYTATVTPLAYNYWGSYGSKSSKSVNWQILKLPASKVAFNISSSSHTGTVKFVQNGHASWNQTLLAYIPWSQSVSTILGGTPKSTLDDTASRYTYQVIEGPTTTSAQSDISSLTISHAGTYKVKVTYNGCTNIEACTKTYTITMNRSSEGGSLGKLRPTFTATKTSVGLEDNEADQGVNVGYVEGQYNMDYSFIVDQGRTEYYQLPLLKADAANKKAGEGKTYKITWTVSGTDLMPYADDYTVKVVKEAKNALDFYYASHDAMYRCTTAVRSSSSSTEAKCDMQIVTNYCKLILNGTEYDSNNDTYTVRAASSQAFRSYNTLSVTFDVDVTSTIVNPRSLRPDMSKTRTVRFGPGIRTVSRLSV